MSENPANLNDFNKVLKSSLLSPSRHRYVATRREQENADRLLKSSKVAIAARKKDLRLNSERNRTDVSQQYKSLDPSSLKYGQSTEVTDKDHLPIISVGGANSVNFHSKGQSISIEDHQFGLPPATTRNRVGARLDKDGPAHLRG